MERPNLVSGDFAAKRVVTRRYHAALADAIRTEAALPPDRDRAVCRREHGSSTCSRRRRQVAAEGCQDLKAMQLMIESGSDAP
jgi:hypothetical protein